MLAFSSWRRSIDRTSMKLGKRDIKRTTIATLSNFEFRPLRVMRTRDSSLTV